jgi:peroxiredoxin
MLGDSRPRSRRLLAAAAGVALGLGAVGAVLAATGDDDDVDGEFVLDQPGIYSEPVTTLDQSGEPLPDVELLDVDDRPVALRSFAGTPLVVNIWYSTCAPCARELRDFAAVSSELGESVQFVGVDPVDDVEAMTEFAAERGVVYPLLRDPDGHLITGLDVAVFPTTLFVSPDGQIVHQTGVIEADDLRRTITEQFGV